MKTYKTTVPELSLRYTKTDFPKAKIGNSKDSADFIRQFYCDDINIYESFFVLLLTRSNTTKGFAKISQGGTCGTVVDVKIIAKYAVDCLASACVIAHNHPSGNVNPSDSDIKISKKIKEAMALLDIAVLDSVILTEESYYSLADNGEI